MLNIESLGDMTTFNFPENIMIIAICEPIVVD